MSSYLLSDRDLSFMADALVDVACTYRVDQLAYPLQWRGFITMDKGIIFDTREKNKEKADLFYELKHFNTLASGYGTNEQEERKGHKTELADYTVNYNDKVKLLFVLASTIRCYLYQCCEGEYSERPLYKALEEMESNLYRAALVKKCGYYEISGWNGVEELGLENEDATNEAIDIFSLI